MAVIKWADQTAITTVQWLWKPFIPFGKVTLVEGNGGDGKTTLLLTIAAMLSKGIRPPSLEDGMLYESMPIEPITTFFVTDEDGVSDTTIPRYERAGGDQTRLAYSGELEHHLTLNEDELYEIINETGARLLIIDPLQSFLPVGTNLGSVTQMRAIFSMLNKVAKTTDCAIVIVGHLNKNEGARDIHRGLGSADIAASVRSVLLVEADKKDRRKRYIRAVKSNFDESDYSTIQLVFDEEKRLSFQLMETYDEEYEDAEQNIGHQRKIDLAMSIIQDMLSDGPAAIDDVIAECRKHRISEKTARRARGLMENVVLVHRNGQNCWAIEECQ